MALSVGILGASGYTGAELLRLLSTHPSLTPRIVFAHSNVGERVRDLYPHLAYLGDLTFNSLTHGTEELESCDVIFSALPHGEGIPLLSSRTNRLIIDLSGDFRLQEPTLYDQWYGFTHSAPLSLKEWIYGLPELFRSKIKGATKVANPGCYATASILAVAPLLKERLIEGIVTIDGVSGTSGAGRAPKSNLHFSHVHEDVRAYKVGQHQHTPEIESALREYSTVDVKISFTPRLVPMVRGIHVVASASLKEGITENAVRECFAEVYRSEHFVQVSEVQRGTKEVRASNAIALTPTVDARVGRVIITAVIDNLVKGAAGQALQNANIALGFDEEAGLTSCGVYP